MTKLEFISQLRKGLEVFPKKELEHYIEYYIEIIDDKIEDGMTEKKAVASVGTPKENITKILEETPLPKIIKNKLKPKRSLTKWELTLIIAGSPLWGSLLVAILAVIVAILASAVAVIISLWAANLAFAATAFAGIFLPFVFFSQGNVPSAFISLGTGLLLAGVSIYMFFGLKALTRLCFRFWKNLILKIKFGFVKKEGAK